MVTSSITMNAGPASIQPSLRSDRARSEIGALALRRPVTGAGEISRGPVPGALGLTTVLIAAALLSGRTR
jgi:hypothetical protein